jgi:SAM-dependent methyltransferase
MKNNNVDKVDLNDFYSEWSNKDSREIDFDIRSAQRKAMALVSLIPPQLMGSMNKMLDFGCGYGEVVRVLKQLLPDSVHWALGVDYSSAAVELARTRSDSASITFEKLPALDIKENLDFLREKVSGGVDAILLIDLLEHVPDCRTLISQLAPFTGMFVIKLPVESSVVDNYFLPKEYPSSLHSNGHLREFDSNSVHYFIRSLGLTPMFETLYRYETEDSFPPLALGSPFKARLVRIAIMSVKKILSWILPTKIFLRLVGGGGYICVASYNARQVLNP